MSTGPSPINVMAERRRQLGTALHELARDLAEQRRQNAALKREIAGLRSRFEREQPRPEP